MRLSRAAAGVFSTQNAGGNWPELVLRHRRMLELGLLPDAHTLSTLITSSPPGHPHGRTFHAVSLKRGHGADPFVAAALAAMYCRRRSTFPSARQLLDEMPQPNTVAWNIAISSHFRAADFAAAGELFDRMPVPPNHVTWSAMISGYAQNGRPMESLLMFARMRGANYQCISSPAVSCAVAACAMLRSLSGGEQMHGCVAKTGSFAEEDEFVGAALVDMYGKCGRLELAMRVFRSMATKSVVAWTSLMANHVELGDASMAVEIFREMTTTMTHLGIKPTIVTLTTLITACSSSGDLLNGKALHGFLTRRRGSAAEEEENAYTATALIHMYHSCGSLPYARKVFDAGHSDGGVCQPAPMWNTMISGYAANHRFVEAWALIRTMCQSSSGGGARLSSVTMATVLPISARAASLVHGMELHCHALKNDMVDGEILVGNGLLDMYAKCGEMGLARNVFESMPERNCISWTTMIDGYGMIGDPRRAMDAFERMVRDEVEPDQVTFVALVSACGHSGLVEEGLRYFGAMRGARWISPAVENYGCLVDLLARSGRIEDARKVIDGMPVRPGGSVWGAMLGACRIHGDAGEAEAAARQLSRRGSLGGGFLPLLRRVYAETGRTDAAAGMAKVGEEEERRNAYSWLEIKEQ